MKSRGDLKFVGAVICAFLPACGGSATEGRAEGDSGALTSDATGDGDSAQGDGDTETPGDGDVGLGDGDGMVPAGGASGDGDMVGRGASSAGGITGDNPVGTGGNDNLPSQAQELSRFLHINEIMRTGGGAVELYNSGEEAIDVSSLLLAGNDVDFAGLCPLSGQIEAGGFLVVQERSGTCFGQPCIKGCSLDIDLEDVVTLYFSEDDDSPLEVVDQVAFPGASGAPLVGSVYHANPDGSDSFENGSPSPGSSNAP